MVVVAHGVMDGPEDAALLCVAADGTEQRLDVRALGRDPGAFCGALVILLSCETGRMGDALAEPGGVAGALIAAGARGVLAPLWPCPWNMLEDVARAVLEGVSSGLDPEVAVARLGTSAQPTAAEGAYLGPARPAAAQLAAGGSSGRLVTWVG